LFLAGQIDAAFTGPAGIGRSGPPRAGWDQAGAEPSGRTHYPLFDNTAELERAYYQSTGIYPLHGLVAVKRAVADSNPDLGPLLQQAFEAAKKPFLDRLRSGAEGTGNDFAHYRALRSIVGDDPLPYGIEANRQSIDALIDAAIDQHILRSRPAVEELFIA
jgi:4,5-dihydroxyphthalate decarboxylase